MKKYIAVDWGSSNLRAYYIKNGDVQKTHASEKGVKRIENKTEYINILKDILAIFNAPQDIPILLSGMVGGTAGWMDTTYINCPFKLNNTAKNLITIENKAIVNPVYIYPGLCIKDKKAQNYGVMRGEEIQVIGALEKDTYDLLILPGTHSKWVHIQNKETQPIIHSFSTVMTGELYEVLLNHSLLGTVNDKSVFSLEGFKKGLQEVKRSNAIIESLFSARSKQLLNDINAIEVPAYLSGMLIASEVKSQLQHITDSKKIGLIGNKHLSELYQCAFQLFNINTVHFLDAQKVTIQGYNTITHDFIR